MIVKILICSVTLICVSAQLMPVMPPETAGNQGTVSFSDLVAMMAMRNQLPVGDQQYTLLNLTGGKPIATVPPTQDWAVVPPQRPPMAPLTPTRPLTPVRPPSPMRPPTNMGPTAADAIKQALPGSVSAAVQAALPQAVQAAVQAALPTAVQTAVKAAGPVQPSQSLSPAVLQSAVRSAVDSAVKSALPTAVQTAVKAAKPMQGPPLISPAAMQTAVQAAVNSAIKTAMPSAVQTAVQSAVKSALPANIGSVIAASPNTTKPQTPKFVGPPPGNILAGTRHGVESTLIQCSFNVMCLVGSSFMFTCNCEWVKLYTVELQWLEHLWNHENMFETEVARANEC